MLLRKDDAWLESLPIPDIRDWRVVDQNGMTVGVVETLAVDPQRSVVEAIYTGANSRFTADSFEASDGVVRIRSRIEKYAGGPDSQRMDHNRFDRIFYDHFSRYYGETEEFERMLAAYQFGREMAGDGDFSGRSFQQAEEDLKARFAGASIGMPYATAREAIRCAYELIRGARAYPDTRPTRDTQQMLDLSVRTRENGSGIGQRGGGINKKPSRSRT